MLVVSMSLMIVGIIIFNTRNVDSIFAYNEVITQESKQYYEYTEESDGTLSTRELSKQDYDINVAVERLRREEQSSYKVVQEGGNRDKPVNPPFLRLPEITLSGVSNNGSTTGSVTVTYQYATSAYYKIGTGSYTSFSSGTVFSNVGSYTIYCVNSDGSVYASFSIINVVGSSNYSFIENNVCYETITTATTTAKSWNYIEVTTSCNWHILPSNSYRKVNIVYNTVADNQYDIYFSNLGAFSYYYAYEAHDVGGEHFVDETGDFSETFNLTELSHYAGVYANNLNNGVCEISLNYPMLENLTYVSNGHWCLRTYTEAMFCLIGRYYIQDYQTNNVGNTSSLPSCNGQPVIIAFGGNIVGNSTLPYDYLYTIANNLTTLGFVVAVASILISLTVLGSVISVLSFCIMIANLCSSQNSLDYSVNISQSLSNSYANLLRIENGLYFIVE